MIRRSFFAVLCAPLLAPLVKWLPKRTKKPIGDFYVITEIRCLVQDRNGNRDYALVDGEWIEIQAEQQRTPPEPT